MYKLQILLIILNKCQTFYQNTEGAQDHVQTQFLGPLYLWQCLLHMSQKFQHTHFKDRILDQVNIGGFPATCASLM